MKQQQFLNGILIKQKPENGILRGPQKIDVQIEFNNHIFTVSIFQSLFRGIKLTASHLVSLDELWLLFEYIDSFMMLFDGKFFPIDSGRIIIDDVEHPSKNLENRISKRLNCYSSADFVKGNSSSLKSAYNFFSAEILIKWIELSEEMDLLHKMVLYSISDVGIPVDIKVAFLIEAFEGLTELIHNHNDAFPKPKAKQGESYLAKCLKQIIERYGEDIFQEEISFGIDNLIPIFVENRNRIAHIRNKERKQFLSGFESVFYLVKFSFLYRVVLLSLLDVPYATYSANLVESIKKWDGWQNVLNNFLFKVKKT